MGQARVPWLCDLGPDIAALWALDSQQCILPLEFLQQEIQVLLLPLQIPDMR